MLVAPSILSADFANLAKEVHDITLAGADWVHVDVMDGHFVPNLTIGPPVVSALKKISKLPLDCHLMIEKPESWIDAFAQAGADIITIHIEAANDPAACLDQIRSFGAKAGITLRPNTPVHDIFPLLNKSDLILIMTVNPGFSGQAFMPEAAKKVQIVRNELKRLSHQALIEVDGGVSPQTLPQLQGTDVLVAGNYIFKNKDYAQAIRSLKEEI